MIVGETAAGPRPRAEPNDVALQPFCRSQDSGFDSLATTRPGTPGSITAAFPKVSLTLLISPQAIPITDSAAHQRLHVGWPLQRDAA
jgi:hypothetical protein